MGATERPVERGSSRGRQIIVELGGEIRGARLASGLSQAEVGRAVRLSKSRVSLIERGLVRSVPVTTLARLLSVVGLELTARAYPGGQPLRDAAHLDLLERLRSRVSRDFAWRTEVPLPAAGDQRAWDAMVQAPGIRIGVEAETKPRDLQALVRRLALKQRDGGVDRTILLLRDSRWNRALVREHAEMLRRAFPIAGRSALDALVEGGDPGGNAIILL